jgi:hypothetical protein
MIAKVEILAGDPRSATCANVTHASHEAGDERVISCGKHCLCRSDVQFGVRPWG